MCSHGNAMEPLFSLASTIAAIPRWRSCSATSAKKDDVWTQFYALLDK
jgi:hypothetical protein